MVNETLRGRKLHFFEMVLDLLSIQFIVRVPQIHLLVLNEKVHPEFAVSPAQLFRYNYGLRDCKNDAYSASW